jgi:hypothetical protein
MTFPSPAGSDDSDEVLLSNNGLWWLFKQEFTCAAAATRFQLLACCVIRFLQHSLARQSIQLFKKHLVNSFL